MDITNLTKSKLRAQILNLYFAHPEKEYYIRELAKFFNKPAAYIRQELLNLEKSGLLKSKFKGKERYFKLNQKYYLYDEIKNIIFKTIGIQGSLIKILKLFKNIQIAFIFGSFAKSQEDKRSDVDLMIIGKPNEDQLIGKISKLESRLQREIDYHIYSAVNFQKKYKAKDSFIKNIMSNIKIFLIGNEKQLQQIIQ